MNSNNSDLLKKWLHRPVDVGTIYHYEDLDEQGTSQVIDEGDLTSQGYKLGRSHTPMVELLRGLLWRDKYWCSEKMIKWLDDYKPELIFYNFTNNLFLQKIVLFIADRYDIPIITAIGDDYYFNDKHSFSPAYHLFRWRYKKFTEEVFKHKGSAVYVCDKIRDKYNEWFGLNGDTVYFNTTINRRPFREINIEAPEIVYFGNIRIGRNIALLNIANALGKINSNYKLQVYANEQDEAYYSELTKHPNVVYSGAIPYSEVMKKTSECDIYVVAEGFREEDINFTRYSLSTKAADGLGSGATLLAYGPEESGLIDYLIKTGAAFVCTEETGLEATIRQLLTDKEKQRLYYDRASEISKKNHTLEGSTAVFEMIVSRAMG